jgi:hypothetical protein
MPTQSNPSPKANVDQLIHKLQSALIQERLQAKAVPPGAVVLVAPTDFTKQRFHDGGIAVALTCTADNGCQIRLQREYCPTHPKMAGRWYGVETRVDANGRDWTASLANDYVTDDFGQLVAVSA